ncbi:TetR/AcrR family transcriptional regulator [Mycolicibacterium porcinum]|uniref:TetR/AcrR family transcriptional regulator n=2 Tax=Mycolicibacterium porcinum TaxID=39693 RepID=A0AAW5T1F9_9MYCO|nr:TetR/AcrR family transcriptional regulator [Mycolicibacterium porcinum]MCV7388921.1 TetR/AcrR family transcriptional regulator [Mycolicibacterium porcinum]ORB44488.1 TetR family transcriptional regulator [Mycolicibacterium porcinum]CDO28165.1 TetR family transcriptional regulator [Mycolicibacterium vulneris]
MTAPDTPLPRVLRLLWQPDAAPRRSRGLTREAIVAAAVELADTDGLAALSMARLAERLGCGTMSLYRHVANKDELVTFMLATGPGPPPSAPDGADWRAALSHWADELWGVYHRHPWILQTAAAGLPADPGQLAWLDAGLATLSGTALTEREKLSAVLAVLIFTRGSAALAIEARDVDDSEYPALLRRLVTPARFPALAAAIDAGALDQPDDDQKAEFHSGLSQLLDGIAVRAV